MKISKMLLTSGALASGRVRHCSEWEITSLAANSRFGASPAARLAASRRARLLATRKKAGNLFGLPSLFALIRRR